jgi:hypothetical protein
MLNSSNIKAQIVLISHVPHSQLQELLEPLFLVISLPHLMGETNVWLKTLKMVYISHKKKILLLPAGPVSLNSVVCNKTQLKCQRNGTHFSIIKYYAGRMVLPFTSLAISFQDVNYYVDTPMVTIVP